MEKYTQICKIGQGTFGEVFKINDENNNIFAAKYINCEKDAKEPEEEFLNDVFTEFFVLQKFDHPYIIKYKTHFLKSSLLNTGYYLYTGMLITEFWGENIREMDLSDESIKTMMFQILSALVYLHENYVHTDIKPDNIVMQDNIFKLIDFGNIIKKDQCSPSERCSLWYRPIEVLLGDTKYRAAMDIWSLGCVFYEKKMSNKPLFPGDSEIDQMYRIFRILGTPIDGYLVTLSGYKQSFPHWPMNVRKTLMKRIPLKSEFDLLISMLNYDPLTRITAKEALNFKLS